jgi:exodeoxyribonuclease VII small subunit
MERWMCFGGFHPAKNVEVPPTPVGGVPLCRPVFDFLGRASIMAEKKFEEAMQRLEDIVEKLEESDLSLNDSLKIFEEGIKLIGFCSKRLEEVEQKVTMLVKENEGKYTQQPFEAGVQGEEGEP